MSGERSRLELRVPPVAVVAICALAIVGASAYAPVVELRFVGYKALAVMAFVLGIGVAAAGVLQFSRARTTVNPLVPGQASAVVSTGIYRWSRNPMYLGMALCLLALAVWRSSLLGYTVIPLFCAYITRFQIAPEERALLANFGSEYEAYMSRVRRWI
jgi:protein-S-isoprenylcysteine O-methyltransferase Ste14